MRSIPVCVAGALMGVGVAVTAHAQVYTTVSGVVVFEAEGYSSNITRGSQSWTLGSSTNGFSGSGYMTALPNSGSNISANVTTTSPELQFPVLFNQVNPYFVWVRAYPISGNDDSIHVGLDGSLPNSGTNLTWSPVTNTWAWTNATFNSFARSVPVGSSGLHTFDLWMREDGAIIDRIALTTNAAFKATIGNAWHIPTNVEPTVTMRSPLSGIQSNTTVWFFSGNQFQGAGNTGDQLQTGSAVIHKSSTNSTWTETPMFFHSQSGNNKYYSNAIPAGTYAAGDTVQYYLRIPYNDHLPTYLYGNDGASFESEVESVAQADPFSYEIAWPLTPAGGYLAITNNSVSGIIEARIYTNSGHLSLVGPDLSGTPLANAINFAPCSAEFGGERHDIGRVLAWSALTNGIEVAQRLSTATVTARLTFAADGVMHYEVIHWGSLPIENTYVTAGSDSNEHFYGFGEKFNSFDQAGKNVRIITDDPPGSPKGDKSYKVAPWFVSTRGYGFHADDSSLMYFDMRASQSDRFVVSNLYPSLKFNVVYGPQLTNVLVRYTGYSGRPGIFPQWALAPWMSSDHWRDGGEVRYVITKYRERGIPGSVFVFDSPWETAYNDFTWNAQQFADAGTYEGTNWPGFPSITNMMDFFRTNGWKVICWMTPFVNTSSAQDEPGITNGYAKNYAEGAASNYFVRSSSGGPPFVTNWWKGTGSPVDFTYPAAAQWLQGQLSNLVADSGGVIGGFKTDDGESGNPPGSYIPTNATYFDGRTGRQMANGYAKEYHRTVWNVLGTNGLLFARSGFSGSQAYSGYWAGDNEPNFGQENGLASVVVAGQSAAMSGYSTWGHDVGGYQDCCYSSTLTNLFMRWAQFGAFSPLMQMHRQVGSGIQYPWSFGTDGLSNYVEYAKLHTALFPYLYTMAYEAASNGIPIIRPLVLMHQDDVNTYGINHTYEFGNSLLVSAIVTNLATTRNVYLPSGTWYDFWTNRSWAGAQNITWTNADQRLYPVFAKAGAIIPMISTNVQTLVDSAYLGHTNLVTWDGNLEVLVYPTTNSSFRMFDGTTFTCSSNATVVTLTITSSARSIQFQVNGGQPAGVEINGVRLAEQTNAATYAALGSSWNYTTGRTKIKVQHSGGTVVITLAPDSVGDGIPNSWRGSYFGTPTSTDGTTCATCDADGDGVSNGDEYRSGTDPTASNSHLSATSERLQMVASTNAVVVSWLGQPGIVYAVAWLNDATNGAPWQPVSSLYTGSGATINWTDDGSQTGTAPENSPTGRRFYRVTVP